MAEGFLESLDNNLEVFSAGISPSSEVHPKAIEVMNEGKENFFELYQNEF